ncbi:MAG: heme A synthase [Gemmatimonadetes bacterium]|nr:heme A synthase [Gemmatimonadota bacterium]
MRTLRIFALVTAGLAYGLIVLGAVVRITGSGMGCGDHWPLCNGQLIPDFTDYRTVIEWTHRLVAAVVSLMVIGVAGLALRKRRELGVAGQGGPLRPALLAAGLLVIPQALLGALAVWRELHATVVTAHFATALALLAALLVTGVRAGFPSGPPPSAAARRGTAAALLLAAGTLLLGGFTASTHAGFACQGFPLCSGRLWPSVESGLAEIQWVHRLAAYALVLHLIGLAVRFRKRGESPVAQRLAGIALAAALLQVLVAAVMVLRFLPAEWRALHAAFGTAVWVAVVWLGARALPWAAGRVWPRDA